MRFSWDRKALMHNSTRTVIDEAGMTAQIADKIPSELGFLERSNELFPNMLEEVYENSRVTMLSLINIMVGEDELFPAASYATV